MGTASGYSAASRKKAGQDLGVADRAGPTATDRHQGRRQRQHGIEEEVGVGDSDGCSVEEQGRADGDGRATAGRVGAAVGMRCRHCTTSIYATQDRGRRW
jgi:hypothetical protein